MSPTSTVAQERSVITIMRPTQRFFKNVELIVFLVSTFLLPPAPLCTALLRRTRARGGRVSARPSAGAPSRSDHTTPAVPEVPDAHSSVPEVPEHDRRALFQKTKMCKFFILGTCSKGSVDCSYAHAAADLRTVPDLSRTKLCGTLIKTGVCDEWMRGRCLYAHNREELRGDCAARALREALDHRRTRGTRGTRGTRRVENLRSPAVSHDESAAAGVAHCQQGA